MPTEPEQPLVSIIIPTFNRPRLLAEALKSVSEQTYPHYEAIIINDAGQDVQSIVEDLHDSRFIYLSHPINKGLPAARNTGLRRAKGKFIAYLDDDDLFTPAHLHIVMDALNAGDHQAAYVDAVDVFCQEKNGVLVRQEADMRSLELTPDNLLISNNLPPICLVHARACLDKIGLFDESLKRYEDWDLLIRLSQHFRLLHIPKTTVLYTIAAEHAQMVGAWTGHFLHAMQLLHARYRSCAKGRPEIVLAQQTEREKLRKYSWAQLEKMSVEQLNAMKWEEILKNIAESSLLHDVEDVRGARALVGHIMQRLPEPTPLWPIYEQLSRLLEGKPQIDPHGVWLGNEAALHHRFDPLLALALVNLVKTSDPTSVVDFGCGMGDYVATFKVQGLDVEGYDGNPATPELTCGLGRVQDLCVPFDLEKRYEWVISLEVGEHLPQQYEALFIDNLIRHCAKGIVISWALKGQGGCGHVNEQPNSYIKHLFQERGFVNEIDLENWLRSQASLPWFKHTLMIFLKA